MIDDPTTNAAGPVDTDEEVQTRSNTIVRPVEHQMPLELRNVTIRYEGGGADPLTIVEQFNLGLEVGTMHCLAGRSGSGKTSILTVAAGLTLPTAGEVLWEGESLDEMDDDEIAERRRALIGYVDQGGALIDGMSALENVLLPAVPDGQVAERTEMARNLLDLVGLGRRMHHRPAQLSGGERQRVAIARALILGSKVLVVDEPTASLDREHANQIIGILKDTTRDGITVLVATHDQELIAVADSRTYMN